MISLLHGTVRHKVPFWIVIEAAGVGYEVFCTQEAFELAGKVGTEAELWTRLVVREDSLTLYGFARVEERALFDQLVAISGVGPKTAVGILSGLGADHLREAIATGDTGRLTGIPGIGRKTAERLIVELRDKLMKEETYAPPTTSGARVRSDALQALIALGYQRVLAEKAIRNVVRDTPEAGKSVEALIKAALKEAA
ncbi:MAG: Holliday junction branch migration protein RuvA [Bacteroidota bacterium]|nr:Holliday junction branch migration protein RuvA [Bacteroidota bacterium]MDP4234688.1 Holliday junction branch migration protein RuvA [Bacteroidota bacterium]MDP4243911.1 Holliday junction branch migration protein RuvA [Bacteroidota bacterium]MDP4288866.1 Holliday junction branch migration protein RuvA [Bacteroidota bacterium]